MRAECTWGDGPDVIIVLGDKKVGKTGLIDLTVDEAQSLKVDLEMAIHQVWELENLAKMGDINATS